MRRRIGKKTSKHWKLERLDIIEHAPSCHQTSFLVKATKYRTARTFSIIVSLLHETLFYGMWKMAQILKKQAKNREIYPHFMILNKFSRDISYFCRKFGIFRVLSSTAKHLSLLGKCLGSMNNFLYCGDITIFLALGSVAFFLSCLQCKFYACGAEFF